MHQCRVVLRKTHNKSAIYDTTFDHRVHTPIIFKMPPHSDCIDNKEEAIKFVQKDGYNLRYVAEYLRDDQEVVMAAVQAKGYALQYASDRLKDDPGVVLAAVQEYGESLKYASNRQRDNRDIVIESVRGDAANILFASKRLRNEAENDSSMVLASLESALRHTDIAGYDRSVIPSQGHTRYIHIWLKEHFWKEKGTASQAIRVNPACLKYIINGGPNCDESVLVEGVRRDPSIIKYIPLEELNDPKQVLVEAVQHDGLAMKYAWRSRVLPLELHCDRELLEKAVAQNGLSIQYASKKLRRDRDLVLAAVEQSGTEAIRYLSFTLRHDKEVLFVSRMSDLGCRASLLGSKDDTCPSSLWPHILSRGNLSSVYMYLKHKPDIIQS